MNMNEMKRNTEELVEMLHNAKTVMIEKQTLLSLYSAVTNSGWDIFGNENTGLHFLNKLSMESDYFNSDSIQIIFGDEVDGATSLEAFHEKAFVYGFLGKEDVINEFFSIMDALRLKADEGQSSEVSA